MIRIQHHPTDEFITNVFISGEESNKAFKELVFRATNLWPDAPPEVKIFADILQFGKSLQDYYAQARAARPTPRT
jgi:hypothetical protein